jgi:TPR repeat protein
MEEYIKKIVEEHKGIYISIGDEKSLYNIYNFYKEGIIPEGEPNLIESLYYGFLFDKKGNKDLSIKYYEISGKKGSVIALKNLAFLNEKCGNYDLFKKYILLAIERGDSGAMYNLGCYYENIEKDYVKMKKYYKMAIKSGDSRAAHNLGHYYDYIENNNELASKYYILAFKNGKYDGALDFFERYENEFSFLELYQEKNFPYKFLKRFEKNVSLPKKYYYYFLKIDILFNDSVLQCIKNKQFILSKTGVWPSNYKDIYMIHFMELLSIRKSPLPRDLLLLIAGYLFI